jgi:micrococcal nuclease
MYTYKVLKVNRVVDGDTVDVTLDLGFGVSIKQRLRVIGVNAPEPRSPDPEQREKAQAAKVFAEQWLIANGQMIVTTYKNDKYGRILGDFRREHHAESFSEALLASGHAVAYTG